MCLQDVLIGRSTTSGQRLVTVSNSVLTVLAEPNLQRHVLAISPPPSGTLFLTFESNTAAGEGWPLSPESGGLILTLQSHGDLVRRGVRATHSVGGVVVAVWSADLPDLEVLNGRLNRSVGDLQP